MAAKKRALTRPERIEALKRYYLKNLAEDSLDESDGGNFDGDVFNAFDDLMGQYPNNETVKPEMRIWIDESENANSLFEDLKKKYYVKRASTKDIIPFVVQGKDRKAGYTEIRNFFLHS